MEPVRRDRRQARADARRHEQLLHQQPAGAPARRAGRLPRHRPRPARLRDHRPGHDLADHREQARRAAPVPRGGRRRLEVQGAPARDREPAQGHAREPDARRGHPARAQRQPRQAREAGRGRAALQRAAAATRTLKQHQLWFLQATATRRASRRASRPTAESPRSPRSSRASPTCAASRPSSRRSARRTTRPATRCTRRRARSYEASARGRAGSRSEIRFVVEGRAARCEQRWPSSKAQSAQWASARGRRGRRASSASAAQIEAAEEQAELLAAQARGAGARDCPTLEEALRAGAGAQPTSSAARSPQVQQQIQVLGRRRSATSRSSWRQAEPAPRAPGRRSATRWPRPTTARLADLRSAARRRRRSEAPRPRAPPARMAGAGAAARRGAARRSRSSSTTEARTPGRAVGARLDALQALQEKVQTEGKLKPWLSRSTGSNRLAGPVDADPHRAGLGERARSGAARAPERARGRPARHGARLRRRRAAGASSRSTRRRKRGASRTRTARCRAWPTCCASDDAGLKALLADWLDGVYTASDFDEALAARASCTHGEVIMTREGHAVSAVRGQLLRARFRAGRPARARSRRSRTWSGSCARRR